MTRSKKLRCAVALPVVCGIGAGVSVGDSLILHPTDDTYVDTRFPDAVYNFEPWEQVLHADYSYIGPHYRTSLLKFDLSAIPSDATLLAATLHLCAVPSSDEHTYLFRMEHDAWDEDSTSWNSFLPHMAGGVLVGDAEVEAVFPEEHWVGWPIVLGAWNLPEDLADGFVTFMLKGDESDFNYTVGADLCSKEYLTPGGEQRLPSLELTWIPEPSTAVSLIVLVGAAALRRRRR